MAVFLVIAGSSRKNMTFLVVVVCNAAIGCYQEIRAKRAVDKLTLVAAQQLRTVREGVITKIFTTNLVYRTPELLARDWYCEVNMCKYVAYIIDTLNHDQTISHLLNQSKKIHALLDKHKNEK